MKHNIRTFIGAAVLGLSLSAAHLAVAQTVATEVTTTTSAGTISEFGPETMVIRSTTSPDPIRYSYSKSTTYVDESGAPVSMEIVKSGVPVTVYYTTVGGRMVASKVIVQRAVTTPVVPVIEEKRTTTTTTETTED